MEVLAKRYEVLIGHAYQCSSLGRLIADKAFDKRVELVADAIGGKAVSTLKKRLASLKDLVAFCCGEGLSAWPLDDQVVIEYTASLIKEGAKVSKLEGALKACNFARFVLGVDVVGEPLKHPVVMGRLRRARLFRAPKEKARAMSVQEIIFLESFLRDASQTPRDRFAYLFAVHSRARMGDLAEVHSFKCDFTAGGGGGYIECVSLSHKSRSFGNSMGLQMFLVAPAQGLGTGFWAHEWVKVWDLSKHPIFEGVQGMPLLQSPMQNGSWSGKKIGSARFVAWVKALLATGGSGMGDLMTGHSAKATALSWLDKAHVSRDDSAILGHHVVKRDRTMLAYSRDHQAGPLRTLERVYRDIREGRFLPDCTRSGYYPGVARSMQSPAQLRSHDAELPAERDAEQSWYRSDLEAEELVGHQPDGTAVEPLPECAVDDLLTRAALDAAADQEGEGSPGCLGSRSRAKAPRQAPRMTTWTRT